MRRLRDVTNRNFIFVLKKVCDVGARSGASVFEAVKSLSKILLMLNELKY